MIVEFYVYLILSENRLVILRQKVENSDYYLILNNSGDSSQINLLESFCKTFCLGFILGSESTKRPINNIYEFQ